MNNKPQRSRAYKIANIIGFVLLFLIVIGVGGYFVSMSKRNSSLEIAVFKGPISGATVNVYILNDNGEKGDLIKGPLTSDASGNVTVDLPANLPKRLLIESSGGSYKNEANGNTIQLKNSDTLIAVLPANAKVAAVTPFTYMATTLTKALIQGGALPDEAVISANEIIAKQYGVRSILDTLPVDASNESSAAQGSPEAKQYGLLLAGFAQLAKNLNVRSADLANAFAKDWSDGKADGAEDGKPITISGGGKLGEDSSKGLSDAAKQFAESNKNFTGIGEGGVSFNNSVPTTIGLRITGASLPTWVSGKKGSYGLEAKGGSLPFVWSVISGALLDGFSLSKDGIISGIYTLPSGVTKKISAPFMVEVKDAAGKTQSTTLSITIVPEAPTISVTNPPTLTVGQSYDIIVATAQGGMPPYIFGSEIASGPLPMGMNISINGDNGYLVGTPKAKGHFSFNICVMDSANTERCKAIAFDVEEKEVATPTSTPTPETQTKWEGAYRGTCTLASSDIPSEIAAEEPGICDPGDKQIYCPPYFFTVTDDYIWNKGAHRRSISDYTKSVGGDIDSSGVTTIQEAESYNDTTSDWSLQFYLSGGEKYVKGTFTHTFSCSWFSIEQGISWTRRCSCIYSLSGGPATAR